LTRQARQERALGIIAWAGALKVIEIDKGVPIVVDPVLTLDGLPAKDGALHGVVATALI
jgi:hypothetical protein